MEKARVLLKNPLTKTLAVLAVCTVASLVGFTAAFGYGGGGGYYAPSVVPSVTTSVNAPLSIGASEDGLLSRSFSDGSKVEVSVPKGAVEGQTIFETVQGGLTVENTPTDSSGAVMIGGQVFNITATDLNGEAVRNFSQPLNITIIIPNLPADTTNLGVYYFDQTFQNWVLIPGATFDVATGKVNFTVNHLTKFAVFEATNSTTALATIPTVPTQEVATSTPVVEKQAEVSVSAEGQVLGTKIYSLDKIPSYGSRGDDVKALQQLLIDKNVGSAAKSLARIGATGYFGSYTRSALAEYQKSVGIDEAGDVGPVTRNYLATGKVDPSLKGDLARNLYFGSRGEDVKTLQQFLIDRNIGSAAKSLARIGATGYFGSYTRSALAEYQKSVGIYSTGNFGPITRTHVSNLIK
ncbi:MAG: peptidoglycan-binding protein [Patescibacteria group bacterium]|jgi:peptidoglycan hydrolase-like protein with peptidoglycan-binding domain